MRDVHAGPAGDVAGFFSVYSHDVNLDHMRSVLLDRGLSPTAKGLRSVVQHLESFP